MLGVTRDVMVMLLMIEDLLLLTIKNTYIHTFINVGIKLSVISIWVISAVGFLQKCHSSTPDNCARVTVIRAYGVGTEPAVFHMPGMAQQKVLFILMMYQKFEFIQTEESTYCLQLFI